MALIEAANPLRNRRLIKNSGVLSAIAKRSIVIAGHKTAVSVEATFWRHFKRIAKERCVLMSNLAASIDARRPDNQNMSSAIRCFVVEQLEIEAAFGIAGAAIR